MDQLSEETEVKQVTRGDRTLALDGPTRLVMLCSEDIGVILRPDAGRRSDLMRRGHVWSLLTIDDVAAF